jgi:hypothetical protein
MAAPMIILYTNHLCPWVHRAHIALKELGLEYKEVIIDLDKPREPWYLEINPVSPLTPKKKHDPHPTHLVVAYSNIVLSFSSVVLSP